MASRVEFQVLGEEQVVSHVMSRYETPWALNVRRLHVRGGRRRCRRAAMRRSICTSAAVTVKQASAPARLRLAYGRRLVTAGERFAENERLRVLGQRRWDV